MYGHSQLRNLACFSTHLEELFSYLSACGGRETLPHEFADEVGNLALVIRDERRAA